MKIYEVVVNKKPSNCIVCPLTKLRLCGKERKVQKESSGAYIEKVPDNRCLLIKSR